MRNSLQLRETTKPQHDLLEEVLGSQKIFSDHFSPRELGRILAVLWEFHQKYEESIFRALDRADFPDVQSRSRIGHLRRDLEHIRQTPAFKNHDPEAQAKLTESEALGWLYVIEGSSLGGNVIMKKLCANAAFQGFPFHYYGAFTEQIGQFWKEFLNKIDALPAEDFPQILKGARIAYAALINIAKNI